MFNEKQKLDYIKLKQNKMNTTDVTKSLANMFEKTSEAEERLGKDLCDFSAKEILDCYKSMKSKSLETLLKINIQFQAYAMECSGDNKEFRSITYEQLMECLEPVDDYLTRKELLAKIKSLENSGDKFIVLALFEGICGSMMEYLSVFTADNLHKTKGNTFVFNVGGEIIEYKVSKELYQFAKDAINEYEYYSDSRALTYNKGDKRALKAMNNAYSELGQESKVGRYHNLANRLLKIKNKLKLNIVSRNGLLENGRLDLIKDLMIQQKIDNPREVILNKDNRKIIEERYGQLQSVKRFLLKYEDVILNMVKRETKT